MVKENNPSEKTHEELCDDALKHYEELSKEVGSWLSTVPIAIKFYKKYGKEGKIN